MSRRRYSPEFKVSAAKLVSEQGYTLPEAAKSFGGDPNSIQGWVKQLTSTDGAGAVSTEGSLRGERKRLKSV